ncbi:DNA-3-methyladenine glycosylase I [Corynebacterium lubricantis]|uniref:DNA-3-methyladenine glycosylase I n=1 Tax=Corynebacterium lubricantis TaxID=541095 RepID=UPI00035EE87F|nr:DNA-3-methyladenine glycosylase I [Corynebacterium lubricantis]
MEQIQKDSGLVTGSDGRARPEWAAHDALLRNYYDTEWGMPIRDEQGVFERLCLQGFQAGLSWRLVLNKREALRRAFHGFSPDKVAVMDGIEHLLDDDSLIRNRRKLQAVITNAQATIALRGDESAGGGLAELIWSYQPDQTPRPRSLKEVPATSDESRALAKDLKKRGFSFVGPTTCFALMEVIGVVDTHLLGS